MACWRVRPVGQRRYRVNLCTEGASTSAGAPSHRRKLPMCHFWPYPGLPPEAATHGVAPLQIARKTAPPKNWAIRKLLIHMGTRPPYRYKLHEEQRRPKFQQFARTLPPVAPGALGLAKLVRR